MNKRLFCISGKAWTGGKVQDVILRVEGERISAIEPAAKAISEEAVRLPEDALILPGLHDAHLHLGIGGLMLGWVDFTGVTTPGEFKDRLRDYLIKRPMEPGQWIEGKGLDESRIVIERRDIDSVTEDTPVFVWSHDLHSATLNSAALIKAGIHGDTKDPAGGKIERDAGGVVNGVLREHAIDIVRPHIPPPSINQVIVALRLAQKKALSLGITAVSDGMREELFAGYSEFRSSDEQKIRLNLWKMSPRFDFAEDRFPVKRSTHFQMRTLKGFTDGALGSRSAAFWEPYADDPENSGILSVREGRLARYVRAAHFEGYQMALHAIGDRANHICLNAFEMAGCDGQGAELRPRIEHCQVLRERDIERFAESGVVASMQPIYCAADIPFIEKRIGRERCKYSYAWKSLKDAGAILAFGSDWPVEDLNPLAGIHAAVTRQRQDGSPAGGWEPQERLTMAQTIDAYTTGSAFAAYWDRETGSIEKGKLADLTVVSKNLFEIEAKEILDTKVLMTVVGGEVVYEAEEGKGKGGDSGRAGTVRLGE